MKNITAFRIPKYVPQDIQKKMTLRRNGPDPKMSMEDVDIYSCSCCNDYTIDINNLSYMKKIMDEYGFTVIDNVFSKDECDRLERGVWHCMENNTTYLRVPLKRCNPDTFKSMKKQSNDFNTYNDSMITHSDFMWKARQNVNAMKVFAELYGCNMSELITSYGGVSIQPPPEIMLGRHQGKGHHRHCSYHVEQSPTQTEKRSFQASISTVYIHPGDYTVGFFAKSHLLLKHFGEKFNITDKANFFQISQPEHMKFYEKRCKQIRMVNCKAGSMVVWDNRTMFSNFRPLPNRKFHNFRTACMLSYIPRSTIPTPQLYKKMEEFRENGSSIQETELVQQLVGFPVNLLVKNSRHI